MGFNSRLILSLNESLNKKNIGLLNTNKLHQLGL